MKYQLYMLHISKPLFGKYSKVLQEAGHAEQTSVSAESYPSHYRN